MAVAITGPKPATELAVNELRSMAQGALKKNYAKSKQDGWPDEPKFLDGPVRPLYAEYDEDGNGIGDPLSDKQEFTFGWHVEVND